MGSRVLREFEYFRPSSIDEAITLLQKHGKEISILAGGTDLLIDMKLLRLKPKYVIDISGIGTRLYC